MGKEIAVFVTGDGETAPALKAANLLVYQRSPAGWKVIRDLDLGAEAIEGLPGLRQKAVRILEVAGSCREAVAESFQGVLGHELAKAGVRLWECGGAPEEFWKNCTQRQSNRR